jgi:hypothetical protein
MMWQPHKYISCIIAFKECVYHQNWRLNENGNQIFEFFKIEWPTLHKKIEGRNCTFYKIGYQKIAFKPVQYGTKEYFPSLYYTFFIECTNKIGKW